MESLSYFLIVIHIMWKKGLLSLYDIEESNILDIF